MTIWEDDRRKHKDSGGWVSQGDFRVAGQRSAQNGGGTVFLSNKNTAIRDTFLRRPVVVHVLMENNQETFLL